MSSSIEEALRIASQTLRTERSRLESEILLAYVLEVPRVYLHTHANEILDSQNFLQFMCLVNRAKEGEPIEYITQVVSFYAKEWKITAGVLIPRPETELLIQYTHSMIAQRNAKNLLEFGIGSGVISITLALLNPNIHIVATDINPLALDLTRENITRFSSLDPSLSQRIQLFEVDILKDPNWLKDKNFDLLVSNPPYIADSYVLPKNVSFEPKEALFGGKNGNEILLKLINLCESYGIRTLSCEMGYDQKKDLKPVLETVFDFVEFYQDWSGLDRGFFAYKH